MRSLNRVILLGNVGGDPEVREFANGGKVCTLSLCTNRSYVKSDGEKVEESQWHRLVTFNEKLIDNVIIPYVVKGAKIYVEGELRTRSYDDDAGITRYVTEVVIGGYGSNLILLSSNVGGGDSSAGGGGSNVGGSGNTGSSAGNGDNYGGNVSGYNMAGNMGNMAGDDEIPF